MSSALIYNIVFAYLQLLKDNFFRLLIILSINLISRLWIYCLISLILILSFWIACKIFTIYLSIFMLYFQRFFTFILMHQIAYRIINLLTLLQLLMNDLSRLILLLCIFILLNLTYSIFCVWWWRIRLRLSYIVRILLLPPILFTNLLP